MSNFFTSALRRIFSGGKKDSSPAIDENIVQETERVAETETPVILTIWTIEHNRYAASRALCTDIEINPEDAIGLYEDIMGYVVDTPNGESVVIESRTGSLVGHSLEVVRDAVREMTRSQLNSQLDTARKEFNRMQKIELTNEEFWKAIRMGGSEIEVVQEYQE